MAEEAQHPARRRILLSVMACSPLWGSEPGVGWHWLLHLARRHEVVVLTHAYFRSHLEPALREHGLQDVEVHYLQAPAFGWHPHRQLNSRLYYSWWQWRARAVVRKLVAEKRYDLIHHLTWGTLRLPCFLGGLGVPLVMGPLGGGESAPHRLFAGIPWRYRLLDLVRSLTMTWVRIDPLATVGVRQAALVICKTEESRQCLPRDVQPRTVVLPEIGSPEPPHPNSSSTSVAQVELDVPSCAGNPKEFKILFAGRLIAWKGILIALGTIELLVKRGLNVHLDIAGDGQLMPFMRKEIARRGLESRVKMLGSIPRAELLSLYSQACLFLFPSLHDSSGNVVLEALSRGLPVVCLDLGGPRHYVDEQSGIVVETRDLERVDLECAIADRIEPLLADPDRLAVMSQAARIHASRQSWSAAVHRAYEVIGSRLGWS